MNARSRERVLNVVDLFCGCGGLACGFELHQGELRYRTVLGIDNNPAAIRIFNANFSPGHPPLLPIGRLADVTWFTHPLEIRLFYLVHCAFSQGDSRLRTALEQLGLMAFLKALRSCDLRFADAASQLAQSREYLGAMAAVPPSTFSLALPQTMLDRLSLLSLSRLGPNPRQLPWCEEYGAIVGQNATPGDSSVEPDADLARDCRALWLERVAQLQEAASKTGRGQNRHNSSRLAALCRFFSSPPGEKLFDLWSGWRGARETVRAQFCLTRAPGIDELYSAERRVHIVLGGPPCKGFSRMGRPVIQALRDQGVHAWSHKEYGDERNSLMCQYVLFLDALRPDLFLFENVANFQSALRTPSGRLDAPALLEELIDDLSAGDLHFEVRHRLVNTRRFSVPQDRRRFIMLGIKGAAEAAAFTAFFASDSKVEDVPLSFALLGLGKPAVFKPQGGVKTDHLAEVYNFFDGNLPAAAQEYLAWVRQPDRATGRPPVTTTAHIYRESRADDRAFLEFVAPGIRWMDLKVRRSRTVEELRAVLTAVLRELSGDLRTRVEALLPKMDEGLMLRLLLEHAQERNRLPEQHLLLDGYLENGDSRHGDWFERLSPGRPCKTIVAHIGKDTYGYWHPFEARALTIREAARVQAFPDWFQFGVAGVVDTYAAIGNAVPPLVSSVFARRVEELDQRWGILGREGDERHVLARGKRARQLELSV